MNLITTENIIKSFKLIAVYFVTLSIFYLFHNDKIRLISLIVLFLICIRIFNISYKKSK